MNMYLPEPLHNRFARLPQTAEEATWVCPVCGVIAPRRTCLGSEVRYVRGRCACQQAEIERQERRRLHREWLDWQSMRTYSWLGRKWDDLALRRKTFENFDARRQPEAFEAARLFAEFPSGSLVLYGTFGTGKTHLLAAVCNCTLLQSAPTTSLFTTAPKFFTAIHELHRYGESFRRLIDYAIATPLLVIDDIDKANYNEFHEQIYFEIVDARINAARPTAISTNRLADLANYVGGAVCSRLRIGQIAVRMVGKDYREEL